MGVLLPACTAAWGDLRAESKPRPVDFAREVRPILAKNCFACHGPDDAHRAAKLRLDQRDSAVQVRRKGKAAIVPGEPGKSMLVERVISDDDTFRMPPAQTGHELTREQVATLKRWVQEGAPYAPHWAYLKPTRPTPPEAASTWPRNALDHFVLATLVEAGLRPNDEADKYTLLRRVSLDLRGLPPSPGEVTEFENDTSPNAFENAVDRFLKDPAFGERWARMWLDLARYADSAGYGSDPLRPNMWRYRDWVIDAFNRNLPFDQFTIQQIAGDLLSNTTEEQRFATAFHRNTMTNTEGGTDDEEFRTAAVKDRVDTTMQVWMGLTMGCAKCHNHKYEPISHKEYYQFFAIFNQTADNDQPNESPTIPAPTPVMAEMNRRIDEQVAALRKKLESPSPELAVAQSLWEESLRVRADWAVLEPGAFEAESGASFRKLPDQSLLIDGKSAATDVYTISTKTDLKGITAFRLESIPDASLPAGGAGRASDGNFVLSRFSVTAAPLGQGNKPLVGRFIRIEIPGPQKILSLAEVQVFSGSENVARKGTAAQSSTGFEGVPARAIDGNTEGEYYKANSVTHTNTESNPWWEVRLAEAQPVERVVIWNRTDGGTGARLVNFRVILLDDERKVLWQQDVAVPPSPQRELSPSGKLSVGLAQAFADHEQPSFPVANAVNQKDLTKSGWAVAPLVGKPHAAVFVAKQPLGTPTPAALTFRIEHKYHTPGFALGRFRLSVTNDPGVLERAKVPADILAIVDLPADKRSREQLERLAGHYRSLAPALKPIRDEIAKLEQARPKPPTLPVMTELPADQRRTTHLMVKGNFLDKGEKVEPGLPAALTWERESVEAFERAPTPSRSHAPTRLELARWLVHPENPLTVRVAVNRFWAQLFGVGLVETEEDFGTQGELPSHPELLDWLAVEYQRLGWDTKALLKLIVTSATYRQSSKVTPDRLAKDPRNRLLSRGPRFRLEAEMVRDQALVLSGLFSRKVGGPSVYPPQPPGLWQAAFNGERTWATSTGEDRYRRGLYTFWRRTIPYPSMATFDAPSRETCNVRRIRTNTPLQAFVTMNDPVYVECSQALARRIMMYEPGVPSGVSRRVTTPEARARFALRLCLCRPPQEEQVKQVLALYETELAHYRKDPAAATKLATDPLGPLPPGLDVAEAAAWTVVANVLLNLDGVMVKG
jgi:hypothetical protein